MKRLGTPRRKFLTALGATGLAAVAAIGVGTRDGVRYTMASIEEECDDFTLRAEWRETYTRDGETSLQENTTASGTEDSGEETTSEEPSIINLDNVLPGDSGTVSVRLEVTDANSDTSVTPEFALVLEGTAENGVTEPEGKAGDDPNESEGELQDFLDVEVWNDDGLFGIDSFGADNLQPDLGEGQISEGSLAEVADDPDNVTRESLGSIGDGETTTVTLAWEFNPDTDQRGVNVTQGDSVTFTFDIYAECSQ